MKNNLYAVILAGGSGTRFWPLSRELYPKQLLTMTGPESMLQGTLRCAMKVVPADHLYIVTHRQQAEAVRMQAKAVIPFARDPILSEPLAKNTAAAIGLAAVILRRKEPQAILMAMPADHLIQRTSRFAKAVRTAAVLAEKGRLVTLGIRPLAPETGYGYIKAGPPVRRAGMRGKMSDGSRKIKVYEVEKFVEKPDRATAKRYWRSGRYYWNSGILIGKAASFLSALKTFQPKLYRGLITIQNALETQEAEKTVEKVYEQLDAISVDYGVLEKIKKGLWVLPVEMGWSDIGSWTAIERIARKDRRGNVTVGNVINLDSQNSVLYADKRLVATIGLSDMVVVDTEDATLVCDKNRVQEIRKVVEILKRRKAEEHRIHRTVFRPWGSFTVVEKEDHYKIKRIVVHPGSRLSLQMHHHRSEHWVVVAGTARVTRGEEVLELKAGESTYIPKKTKHRLENPGSAPLQIIEVQNGDYLGEDDIVRFEDDYGRVREG